MKFINAIICDEVRKEDNGKHILIGVYPADIRVPEFPTNLILSMWFQFYVERDGTIEMEYRAVRKDGDLIFQGVGMINIEDFTLPVTVVLNKLMVQMESEGNFIIQIREKAPRKKWQVVKTIPVIPSI